MKELLIENVNLINPNEDEPLSNVSVYIQNGKIFNIGNNLNVPDDVDVSVIDGDDKFILPGFIDMHTHLFANGFKKEDNMRNPLSIHFFNGIINMKDTINAGVTTVRDCGMADIGAKIAQERRMFPGPKMLISVTPLSITGGHFDLTFNSGFDMRIKYPGLPSPLCDGVESVIHKTREIFRARADFVKVMVTGGALSENDSSEFAQFNVKELVSIVNEAKMRNSHVAAHAHGLQGIKNAFKAGVSSIEHGTYIDKSLARLLAKKGIPIIPTIMVIDTLVKNGNNLNSEQKEKVKELNKVQKENKTIAYEEGVKMFMGTDSGVIPHGNNLKELEFLVELGMKPSEAIAAGTIEPAKFLGYDSKIGSIEPMKSADVILCDKNPLEDISYLSNSENIPLVVQDGYVMKNTL